MLIRCLMLLFLFACAAPSAVARGVSLPRFLFGVRVERGVVCLANDGVKLFADVYHPVKRERTPTILVRIPYTKTLKNRFLTDVAGRLWAERGNTVVIQTTRGRGDSGGRFYPLIHEREDGLATLAWLKQQPWFNGQVATWGGSAFGHTAWAMSDGADPPVAAMFVYESTTDFHKMLHPGGAFALQSALTWAVNSNGSKDLKSWPEPRSIARGAQGVPVLLADDKIAGYNIDFFDDWAIHCDFDEYWRSINGVDRAAKLNAPVMMMAGWYDPFLPAQLADYAALQPNAETRLVIGPWRHGGDFKFPQGNVHEPFRSTTLTAAADWFDTVFTSAPLEEPPVKLFVMGANRWRSEKEWPLARTQYTPYYLSGSGLSTLAPLGETRCEYDYDSRHPTPTAGGAVIGPGDAIFDQRAVEARPDMLCFTTDVLQSDTEITGPVKAVLHVLTTAGSADFTAKLVDVLPDGRAYNICDGILRRAYKPGEVAEIDVELWPTSMVFRKGHRIRVEISSSNFPRFDVNCTNGRQTILCGPSHPSRVVLPLIPSK